MPSTTLKSVVKTKIDIEYGCIHFTERHTSYNGSMVDTEAIDSLTSAHRIAGRAKQGVAWGRMQLRQPAKSTSERPMIAQTTSWATSNREESRVREMAILGRKSVDEQQRVVVQEFA